MLVGRSVGEQDFLDTLKFRRRFGHAAAALARDQDMHIRAKRLRYATEAIGPALEDRAPVLERVAAAAASLQDLLGEMHDAFVTRADLEGLVPAAKAREYAFALGRLVERRSASIREGRRRYPRAWRRLAKRWRKA